MEAAIAASLSRPAATDDGAHVQASETQTKGLQQNGATASSRPDAAIRPDSDMSNKDPHINVLDDSEGMSSHPLYQFVLSAGL